MDKTVLAYIQKDDKILMLFRNKKENDLNMGKWIGIGGHIEIGEDKEIALRREIKEETGLDVLSYQYRGEILFQNDIYEEIMYLFIVDSFKGSLIPCDEGALSWIDKKDIMSLNMWEGDRIFLPILLTTDEMINLVLRYSGDKLVEVIKR